jgi:zinc transporter ZupT
MLHIPNLALFFITFLSGLFAYFYQKKSEFSIKLFLSFSGAFLLSTCVIHLLPELFERDDLNVAPYILLGFLMQITIEYFSQGLEHGHIHPPHHHHAFPTLIYTGLCIHAFTEGLPLAGLDETSLALPPLYWGILLHKVPIAIILITLFAAYEVKMRTTFIALGFFSLMAPLGGLIGHNLISMTSQDMLIYFLAASTGIFLHISTVILFETSHNHRFNLLKFLFIVAGGLLSILIF